MQDPTLLVELKNISRHYQLNGASRQVLDGISLQVHSGDSIAITGPSGSGKTTLLNLLGLLDTPDTGSISFRGQNVHQLTPDELADIRNAHIGFIFQLHYLLPQLSLIENVLVPLIPVKDKERRKLAAERSMDLLSQVGLADKHRQRPAQLSVGECQRAAVVRALVNQPELVLADEPTGSLDHDSGAQLGELLVNLCSDLSVGLVTVTHSEALAHQMRTRYKLFNGNLLSL